MTLFAFKTGKLYFLRVIIAINDIDTHTQMVVV